MFILTRENPMAGTIKVSKFGFGSYDEALQFTESEDGYDYYYWDIMEINSGTRGWFIVDNHWSDDEEYIEGDWFETEAEANEFAATDEYWADTPHNIVFHIWHL